MHRPCLSPGTLVLRTDTRRVQIGQPALITLPDAPSIIQALNLIDGSRSLDDLSALISSMTGLDGAELLNQLIQHGAIVDAREWDYPEAELRSAAIALGASARKRLERRRNMSVSVTSDGPTRSLAIRLARVLKQSGVRITRADSFNAQWRIVVCDGEPPRSALTILREQDQPFAVLSILRRSARWGPVIEPHVTPCWRCFDAHMADGDRHWLALATQFGTRAAQPAVDTLSIARQTQIIGHVAEDICHLLDTGASAATGAVVMFSDTIRRQEFGFHHECDCSLIGPSQRHLS